MTRRTALAFCLSTLTAATLLAACGGGDDSANANANASTGGGTVALAAFVVSAANPSSYNGTYSKTAVQVEHGSSNAAMSTYNASDDHCRVGVYTLRNGAADQFAELSFRKDTRAVGKINFGTGVATNLASATGPQAGVVVDASNRRVGFTNVLLTTGSTTVTLNGSMEYISNVDPAARPACG